MPSSRTERSSRLHRYSWFLVGTFVLLIFFGGQVKSTESGLSVPDWPNTFGHFMFTFPWESWVGGVFWEHSHRLIASAAGAMSIIALIWVRRVDSRRLPRVLALWLVIIVCVQGLFGGLTVLNALPVWASSTHGTLAQICLALSVVLAMSLSPRWEGTIEGYGVSRSLRRLALIVPSLIFIQLLIGAIMRHSEAGLAVPDFPTMFGSWIPPLSSDMLAEANAQLRMNNLLVMRQGHDVTMIEMVFHLLHRAMAFVVAGHVAAIWWRVNRELADRPSVARPSALLLGLVVLQFILGILTILTGRHFIITSLHVTVGALLFATAVALAVRLRSARLTVASQTEAVPPRMHRERVEVAA